MNDINVEYFKDKIKELMINNICSYSAAKAMLKGGHPILFNYKDKNEHLITAITVNLDDCHS